MRCLFVIIICIITNIKLFININNKYQVEKTLLKINNIFSNSKYYNNHFGNPKI